MPADPQTRAPGAYAPHSVALMVTRRCNMACAHCSVESGPRVRGEPAEEDLLRTVRELAAEGVSHILFTGGEPMLREELVVRLMREATSLGVGSVMTSNGFWGKKLPRARSSLAALQDAGLDQLTLSYDRYHAAYQGHEPILHIARAAEELRVPLSVSITRESKDAELEGIVRPVASLPGVQIRLYDVQPVGRARDFDASALRTETRGFCSACHSPAITDDLRVTACNGPSYFAPEGSPLRVGSLREEALPVLLRRHREDPILDTIRLFGPERLRQEMRQTPGLEDFPFRDRYSGICDLCLHITSSPEAVQALRTRLAAPARVAERQAARRLVDAARTTRGVYNRRQVNRVGAVRLMLDVARRGHLGPQARWEVGADRILGRADLDWNRLASELTAAGLARPLAPALDDRELTRWAPDFFVAALRTAALRSTIQDGARRDALRRIAAVLRESGTRGVVLKGAALALLDQEDAGEGNGGSRPAPRAYGDIDLYVDPAFAPVLRERLLREGLSERSMDVPDAHHHLAPVYFRGVPIEIHTRIMPAELRAPEAEMLARARPLRVAGMEGLDVLDAEGQVLHAVVHTTQHYFRFGLKCAWDVHWIVERNPGIDWDRVGRWVSECRWPLGFQVPAGLLARELGVPLPAAVAGGAHAGADASMRRRYLDAIAMEHLFDRADRSADRSVQAVIVVLLCRSAGEAAWEMLRRLPHACTVLLREARGGQGREAPVRPGARVRLRRAVHRWKQLRALARAG